MNKKKTIKKRYYVLGVIVLILIIWFSIRPSNDRDWSEDQKVLSYAEFDDNLVKIYNIRNFTYRSTTDYDIDYYDKTFDVDKIKEVYYIVEPFSDWDGAAHTFLSFEFEDNEFVAISIEIRKEKGESFSGFKGLFKQYEIMYVVGDERDLIKLRSNYRKDDVFLYHVNSTKKRTTDIFVDMIKKVNKLKDEPEFYNTIKNSCTTSLVSHTNAIYPGRISFDLRILAPGYSDRLAYEIGLLNTTLSFEEARKKYRINDLAMKYADSDDFSVRIRENIFS